MASISPVEFTVTTTSGSSAGGIGGVITFNGYNIGGHVEIGGNICHLCGAEKTHEDNSSYKTKHGQWKKTSRYQYKCGTVVGVSAKGKRRVYVGKDCIKTA